MDVRQLLSKSSRWTDEKWERAKCEEQISVFSNSCDRKVTKVKFSSIEKMRQDELV